MAGCCNHEHEIVPATRNLRRALWAVIAINAAMFATEMTAGQVAGSQALQADALDFLGDTLTYGLSLFALGLAAIPRARIALLKGASLGVFGVAVLGMTAARVFYGGVPEAEIMGWIAMLALAANGLSVLLLLKFREGDANLRSVWLCSRNDAIGNVAVLLAAAGVFGTGTAWPDLLVAAGMAGLFVWGAVQITAQARGEIAAERSRLRRPAPAISVSAARREGEHGRA